MMPHLTMPSLFLIGAPKCGTTSLAAWLAAHPGIFMCTPKEPDFFAPDVASSIEAHTLTRYQALFAQSQPCQICGEASTTYLRSGKAVPALLDAVPEARLVVCLRHPVDLATSVHGQLVRTGRETEPNFAKAWALQGARRAAPAPRRPDHNPADQLYGDMARLGAQVDRLLTIAPREQVLFLFLEDMRHDPGLVYRAVLSHAGVVDDGRSTFPVLNERRAPRSLAMARLSHLAGAARRRLGLGGLGLGRILNRLNESTPTPKTGPDPRLRAELDAFFRDDIALLARLTERNLDHWLAPETSMTQHPETTS
jgi:hypothetical protein